MRTNIFIYRSQNLADLWSTFQGPIKAIRGFHILMSKIWKIVIFIGYQTFCLFGLKFVDFVERFFLNLCGLSFEYGMASRLLVLIIAFLMVFMFIDG